MDEKSTFTVQVQDSPVAVPGAPPPLPHIDRALLSISVSSLSMHSVTASTMRGDNIAMAGDTVTIQAVVANAGPSTATNIQVTDTPTNLTITNVSGACTALPCTIATELPSAAMYWPTQ